MGSNLKTKRVFNYKNDEDSRRLVSDFVGNTPFVQLSDKIYAKLESVNPGGSIKDRPVKWIIDHAERNDLLKPNDKKGVDNTGKDLTPFSVRWEDAAEAIKLALEIDLKRLPSRSEKYFIFADLPHNKFSNKKAKEQLRWSPKYNLKDAWNR